MKPWFENTPEPTENRGNRKGTRLLWESYEQSKPAEPIGDFALIENPLRVRSGCRTKGRFTVPIPPEMSEL